jgi:hypothetical protein
LTRSIHIKHDANGGAGIANLISSAITVIVHSAVTGKFCSTKINLCATTITIIIKI